MHLARLWDRLSSRDPVDRPRVFRRLLPLDFTVVTPAEHDACLALHKASETDYLPSAHRPIFQEALESRSLLMLLARREDRIVACCGLQQNADSLFWLCYGLVHPAHRNQGVGTTLFFVRMGLLSRVATPVFTVGMSAIATNFPFYARLGFYSLSHVPNACADGNNYPVALLENMSANKAARYRERALAAGVTLPSWDLDIPLSTRPETDTPAN